MSLLASTLVMNHWELYNAIGLFWGFNSTIIKLFSCKIYRIASRSCHHIIIPKQIDLRHLRIQRRKPSKHFHQLRQMATTNSDTGASKADAEKLIQRNVSLRDVCLFLNSCVLSSSPPEETLSLLPIRNTLTSVLINDSNNPKFYSHIQTSKKSSVNERHGTRSSSTWTRSRMSIGKQVNQTEDKWLLIALQHPGNCFEQRWRTFEFLGGLCIIGEKQELARTTMSGRNTKRQRLIHMAKDDNRWTTTRCWFQRLCRDLYTSLFETIMRCIRYADYLYWTA